MIYFRTIQKVRSINIKKLYIFKTFINTLSLALISYIEKVGKPIQTEPQQNAIIAIKFTYDKVTISLIFLVNLLNVIEGFSRSVR